MAVSGQKLNRKVGAVTRQVWLAAASRLDTYLCTEV